jgi:ATP-dependent protease HslVU (ClpYQ) peptidase subunit
VPKLRLLRQLRPGDPISLSHYALPVLPALCPIRGTDLDGHKYGLSDRHDLDPHMSIVAWDGATFATDRQMTASDYKAEGSKSLRVGKVVIAWTGSAAEGLALADWFQKGADRDSWPECQAASDRWCRLIVASQAGVYVYEQEPFPIPVLEIFSAWGSGRDFALGALAMGATAKQAVEVANKMCAGCGFGVDVYTL